MHAFEPNSSAGLPDSEVIAVREALASGMDTIIVPRIAETTKWSVDDDTAWSATNRATFTVRQYADPVGDGSAYVFPVAVADGDPQQWVSGPARIVFRGGDHRRWQR